MMMATDLEKVLGWGSPIGLAVFFIALGLLFRLTGWGKKP